MNRHIFGISTYFLTFLISVILVALFGIEEEPVTEKVVVNTKIFTGVARPTKNNFETVEQREIKKFLETDRSFANKNYQAEEYRDKWHRGGARKTSGKVARKDLIIRDMKELLKTSSLPAEIQIAYQENISAWENEFKHLKYAEMRNYHSEPDEECAQRIKEINFTYENLLKTAKNYGVDYR